MKSTVRRFAFFARVVLFSVLGIGPAGLHAAVDSTRLIEGRFGKALNLGGDRKAVIYPKYLVKFPATVKFWFRLDRTDIGSILLSAATGEASDRWQLSTVAGDGALVFSMAQLPRGTYPTGVKIADGQWHFIAMDFASRQVRLYVDGREALRAGAEDDLALENFYPLVIGAASPSSPPQCFGAIDELSINEGAEKLDGVVPTGPTGASGGTQHLYHFDELSIPQILWPMDPASMSAYGFDAGHPKNTTPDATNNRSTMSAYIYDKETRLDRSIFLDEMQDRAYAACDLFGDPKVEQESRLPATEAEAKFSQGKEEFPRREAMSLSGSWLMKDSQHFEPAGKTISRRTYKGLEERWQKPDFDRSDWYPVEVPTSVQVALVKLGKLPDPNWSTNTYDELNNFGEPKDARWNQRFTRIEQKDWWFARRFTAPSSWKGRKLRLYFDGLDYSGSIYLNGQSLGYHAGMFGGPTLDVTHAVRFDGPNWLVVRIDRVPPTSYGILKGQAGWGIVYGHLVSLGIWRDVTLEALPGFEVADPYVVTKSIQDGKAVLQVEYYVDSHEPGIHAVEVNGSIVGANFESEPINFKTTVQAAYGRSRFRSEIVVEHPHLWWPVNYGKQNLYTLELSVGGNGKEASASGGISRRFGIRTIEMRATDEAVPEQFYKWQFVINGQPMFIKGMCWYWPFPTQVIEPGKYERLLELCRRAGVQMFRVGGYGQIENDEFYRLCDEKGLMVYQEFPFCWGPPDFPFTDPVVEDQQVSLVVKRLRDHPSLVMWGGGNENNPIVGNGTMGNDEALFLLGKRCREYDPSRPFHRTDAWGGSAHNWQVWESRVPFDTGYKYYPSAWYGEFGVCSILEPAEGGKFLSADTLRRWPPSQNDGAILSHITHFNFNELIKALQYSNFGPTVSLETYAEYTQMAQGDWLRYAAEGQRSSSGDLGRTGFWYYKFGDPFPNYSSFSIVDYYGAPKLSYYRAKQTFKPQCAFAFYEKLNWAEGEPFKAVLFATNDTSRALASARVTATIYGSDLQSVWSKDYAVNDLGPNRRIELDAIKVAIDPAKKRPFLLAVTMRDPAGKRISDQWYWLNSQVENEETARYAYPVNLRKIRAKDYEEVFRAYASLPEGPLLTLPKTTLVVRRVQDGRNGYFSVKNGGNLPAFNVLIDNFPNGFKDFLDDNSFCLRPGEERKIKFELGEGESVDGVMIRAWNAPAAKLRD